MQSCCCAVAKHDAHCRAGNQVLEQLRPRGLLGTCDYAQQQALEHRHREEKCKVKVAALQSIQRNNDGTIAVVTVELMRKHINRSVGHIGEPVHSGNRIFGAGSRELCKCIVQAETHRWSRRCWREGEHLDNIWRECRKTQPQGDRRARHDDDIGAQVHDPDLLGSESRLAAAAAARA